MKVAPAKARRVRWTSLLTVAVIGGFVLLFGALRASTPEQLWFGWLPAVLIGALGAYLFMTRQARRRASVVRQGFPAAWRQILHRRVAYYNMLDANEKRRFEQEVAVFLAEKRITGVKTKVDDTVRVLVAASAVIPIFGFPEWEYGQLAEVLVYPAAFDDGYRFGDQKEGDSSILGLVGTGGALNRMMILSKPDLLRGFAEPTDELNVGVHEFAHLVDGADGAVDGIPVGMPREAVGPWMELVRREITRIDEGDSMLRQYGATNEAEFFAVASEAFFENPTGMVKRHPELYGALRRAFGQDTRTLITSTLKSMLLPYPRKVGRNAPCPCGSGEKFKRCCLGQQG